MNAPFEIRLAGAGDRPQILQLLPRLRAFSDVPLRSADQLDEGERRTIDHYFAHELASGRLRIAESLQGTTLGFVYAETATDYFTQESHGHLGILAVSAAAEGHGVAKALLLAVEAWARLSGFRFVTLNVFSGNSRARHFYTQAGFAPDVVRCLKPLGENP